MSLTLVPERNSAPPVDTWTMPSLSASANPRSAAFSVSEEVTLIGGIGELALCPVQHLGVDLGGCDRHGVTLLSRIPGASIPHRQAHLHVVAALMAGAPG